MIHKLLYKSRTSEVYATANNLLLAYNKRIYEGDQYMADIFNELQTSMDTLKKAINRRKAKSKLDKIDTGRDEKIKALNYLLLGAKHHPEALVKKASERLSALTAKYGLKMIQQSYSIKSSLTESLIEELSAPELQASIATISGCQQAIAEMQSAQDIFTTAHFSWEEEKAQEKLTRCATDIKKEMIVIINNKIVLYLNTMNQVNEAVYGELAQTASQIIKDSNLAVKKRSKKQKEEILVED